MSRSESYSTLYNKFRLTENNAAQQKQHNTRK